MATIDVDLNVEEEEAAKLMFHHLTLAQSFFEASFTDLEDIKKAAPQRLKDSVYFEAVCAWLETLNKQY